LGIYPGLGKDQLDYMVKKMEEFFGVSKNIIDDAFNF